MMIQDMKNQHKSDEEKFRNEVSDLKKKLKIKEKYHFRNEA